MLDSDLAALYGVTTARFNQQVNRNLERFPNDFMFQLTNEEFKVLMLQIATPKKGCGDRRKLPLVFTEHGAIMAAPALNSTRALQMGVLVVRAFVKLREIAKGYKELVAKITELERRVGTRPGHSLNHRGNSATDVLRLHASASRSALG